MTKRLQGLYQLRIALRRLNPKVLITGALVNYRDGTMCPLGALALHLSTTKGVGQHDVVDALWYSPDCMYDMLDGRFSDTGASTDDEFTAPVWRENDRYGTGLDGAKRFRRDVTPEQRYAHMVRWVEQQIGQEEKAARDVWGVPLKICKKMDPPGGARW
jgi:hypothetical protein